MEDIGLFEKYAAAASIATTFAGLGGNCDEFIRFLQLEWESYADEPEKDKLKSYLYRNIRDYKKYREGDSRDWRKSFGSRDFNDLLV